MYARRAMQRGLLRPLSGRERILVVTGVVLAIVGGLAAGSVGSASDLVRDPDGPLVAILSIIGLALGVAILVKVLDRAAIPVAVALYVVAYGLARWIA